MANKTIIDTLSEYQKNYLYDTYEAMKCNEKSNPKRAEVQSQALWEIAQFLSEDKGREAYCEIMEYCEKRYEQENN